MQIDCPSAVAVLGYYKANSTRCEEIYNQLGDRARYQGFVTFSDIFEHIPDVEGDVGLFDDVLECLEEAGIKVIQGQTNEDECSPIDSSVLPALELDRLVEHCLYITTVPLLTRQQEVLLVRRIEDANTAIGYCRSDEFQELSWEEKQELSAMIKAGEKALQHFIRANAGLVYCTAKKYSGVGVPFEDILQEGNIGLWRAISKFNCRLGYKFSTYAIWLIRQAILRAIADKGRLIRLPVYMVDRISRLHRIQVSLRHKLGYYPNVDEIAAAMKTSVDEVWKLKRISRHPISLDDLAFEHKDSHIVIAKGLHHDSDRSEASGYIVDNSSPAHLEAEKMHFLRAQMRQALDRLPVREAHILRLRFGLADGNTYTLEEVGRSIGVTRERVRQIEARALRRLRRKPENQVLKDYFYQYWR